MDFLPLLFAAVFVFVIGRLVYGRMRHGSWTGSFLGGSIERTVGEVTLEGQLMGSQVLKVHLMKGAGEDFVAMVLVSKAPLGASMQPIKLTREQAGTLAGYLQDAAR